MASEGLHAFGLLELQQLSPGAHARISELGKARKPAQDQRAAGTIRGLDNNTNLVTYVKLVAVLTATPTASAVRRRRSWSSCAFAWE